MATADAERRMRSEIENVLNTYGVAFDYVERRRHSAVEFYVNGKKFLFTYAANDPRAHLNARSDLRNMLNAAGLAPQVAEPRNGGSFQQELLNSSANLSMHNNPHLAMEVVEPPEEEPLVNDVVEDIPMPEQPPDPPVMEPILEEEEEVMPPTVAKLNPDDAYGLFTPRQLVPGQCIVIELDRDIMATKGSLLVIPLHKPNTVVELTRDMFDAMFMAVPATPESAPPPRQAKPKPAPKPEVSDDEILDEEDAAPAPHIKQYPAGASGLRKGKGGRRLNVNPNNPYRVGPRSIDGISPQAGRVLATMMHVSDSIHKADLTPAMVHPTLAPSDKLQYAARMTGLIAMKMCERGLPLMYGSGFHYKITTAGRRMARKLGAWPWLYDGFDVPSWVQTQ